MNVQKLIKNFIKMTRDYYLQVFALFRINLGTKQRTKETVKEVRRLAERNLLVKQNEDCVSSSFVACFVNSTNGKIIHFMVVDIKMYTFIFRFDCQHCLVKYKHSITLS
jgi:hypothetical protein